MKRRKKKSSKGILVKGYIPPISRNFIELDFFENKMKEILKGNSGLYVLYNNDDLYYVGITKDLFRRLYHHRRDKHKNKWNRFSVFIIGRGKYLKDIESMAQLISNPPANVWKGRFKEHYQYDDEIKKMVKDVSKIIEDMKTSIKRK